MKRLKLNFGHLQSAELLSREQLKNVLGGSKLVGSTADCSGDVQPMNLAAPIMNAGLTAVKGVIHVLLYNI